MFRVNVSHLHEKMLPNIMAEIIIVNSVRNAVGSGVE